jgi:NAD(P)-dependent dehydrogenase (short-subunit alcohol dehydrogenase family)
MSTLDRFSLKDKTVIVTGASQGIGESIALGMAEAGANVVLAARSVDKLDTVATKIEAIGGSCIKVKTDVQKSEDIDAMVQATVNEFGTVDCLVNNAGINLVKPALDISEEEWDTVIDTNLKGYFLCSQAAGRVMMKNGGGSIINNASVFGLRGFINLSAYIASKGGVVQLTRGLAVEWARQGIRVNCVAPGYTLTEMTKRDIEANPAILKFNLRKIPMNRGCEPREISDVMVFAASDAASYMTGQIIAVDGGWTAF